MYKTSAKVESTRREYIEVEVTEDKQHVTMLVREIADCAIAGEAAIRIPSDGFLDLVAPILNNLGHRVVKVQGAI